MLPPKVDTSRRRSAVSRRCAARGSSEREGPATPRVGHVSSGSDRRTRLAEPAPHGVNGRKRCGAILVGAPKVGDDRVGWLPRGKAPFGVLSKGGPRIGTGTLPRARGRAEPAQVRLQGGGPPDSGDACCRPHAGEPLSELGAAAAHEEGVASMRLTQPDRHPMGEVPLRPRPAPRVPTERARRHRLRPSHILFQPCRPHLSTPIVRSLHGPDRAVSTCYSATRKRHKSVSSVCRSTTPLTTWVCAKWQFPLACAAVACGVTRVARPCAPGA